MIKLSLSCPPGTSTIYVLTDFIFILPVTAAVTWFFEFDTLPFGIMAPYMGVQGGAMNGAQAATVAKLVEEANDRLPPDQVGDSGFIQVETIKVRQRIHSGRDDQGKGLGILRYG